MDKQDLSNAREDDSAASCVCERQAEHSAAHSPRVKSRVLPCSDDFPRAAPRSVRRSGCSQAASPAATAGRSSIDFRARSRY
eukprot:4759684-Prymnesium_polylepis.2